MDLPSHLRERLQTLAALVGGPGRLLEVGCGFGTFLARAHADGWRVWGIDVSQWAADWIRERYGLTLEVGDVAVASLPAEPMDVVHLNHTLEHLEDPLRVLGRLSTVLRHGGILALEVPNEIDCLFDRVRWTLLGRAAPLATDENMHELFFNARAITIALERAGLTVLRLSTVRRNVDRDSRLPLGSLAKRFLFLLERALHTGPNLVVLARRP